jgi:NADH:ubiquinone reductase (H+-translocating)
MPHKQVVIIGDGFGGLTAAESLRDADVVLVDRTSHHLFQPLLYQVATSALSPGDIAWPLRTIFRRHPHVRVVMDEVSSIDRTARLIRLRDSRPIPFDVLILAPGSRHSYFGHDAWEESAPGLKTLADAVYLREKMLLAFEEAERRRMVIGTGEPLTFVIVGGGPTGVELAGSLAEIGRKAMGPDFPNLHLDDLNILLVEGGSRVLSGFSPDLSANAAAALKRKGVTIKLNSRVSEIRADGLMIGSEFVWSTNILWAAGNRASPLLASLGLPRMGQGGSRFNVI